MQIFKTICPFCETENDFEIPTYQESLNVYEEALKENPEEEWAKIGKEDVEKEKDLTKLDEDFFLNTPIFCKECKESYYFNPQENEYDYIEPYHELFSTKKITKKLNKYANLQDTRMAYIYFLYNPANGFTKIGYAQDIKNRQIGLRVSLVETELKAKIAVLLRDAPKYEKMFHNMFSEKHIKREWYSLDDETLERIARRENLVQSMLAEGKSYNEIKAYLFSTKGE